MHWGILGAPGLKPQGAKPLFRSISLAMAVSSLPVQTYDAAHSRKSLMKLARYAKPLVDRSLLFPNSF